MPWCAGGVAGRAEGRAVCTVACTQRGDYLAVGTNKAPRASMTRPWCAAAVRVAVHGRAPHCTPRSGGMLRGGARGALRMWGVPSAGAGAWLKDPRRALRGSAVGAAACPHAAGVHCGRGAGCGRAHAPRPAPLAPPVCSGRVRARGAAPVGGVLCGRGPERRAADAAGAARSAVRAAGGRPRVALRHQALQHGALPERRRAGRRRRWCASCAYTAGAWRAGSGRPHAGDRQAGPAHPADRPARAHACRAPGRSQGRGLQPGSAPPSAPPAAPRDAPRPAGVQRQECAPGLCVAIAARRPMRPPAAHFGKSAAVCPALQFTRCVSATVAQALMSRALCNTRARQRHSRRNVKAVLPRQRVAVVARADMVMPLAAVSGVHAAGLACARDSNMLACEVCPVLSASGDAGALRPSATHARHCNTSLRRCNRRPLGR